MNIYVVKNSYDENSRVLLVARNKIFSLGMRKEESNDLFCSLGLEDMKKLKECLEQEISLLEPPEEEGEEE
jgi:hypothetical protein